MHFRSPLGERSELDLIHEGAHIKNSSSAWLQQILRIQWVRHLVGMETASLISDRYRKSIGRHFKTYVYFFA